MDIICCVGKDRLINWANVEELEYVEGYTENIVYIRYRSGHKTKLVCGDSQLESLKSFLAAQTDILSGENLNKFSPDRTKIKTDIPE